MFKNFLDDFFDILFNPVKGLSRVAEDRSIWHGLVVYLTVSIVVSLATLNISHSVASPWIPPELAPYFPVELFERTLHFIPLLMLFLQLFFGPLYFFLMVAILNFVTSLFDGEGKVISLGAVLGYSYLPFLVVAVGGLLGRYTAFNIVGLVGVIAFFWSLWLKIAGIKTVHGFSWGRSVLAFFMPFIIFVTSFILFSLLTIVFLLPMVMQAMEGLPEYSLF